MKKWKSVGIVIYCIVLAAVLTMLGITGKITRTVVSESGVAYEQKVDFVAFGCQLKQDFVPLYDNIQSIKIHVDASACARELGELQVSILNENNEQTFFYAIPISELPQYGWVEAPVNMQLTSGQVYTIVLESVGCVDNGPKITFLDSQLAATAEQKDFNLVYAGIDVEQSVLKASFIYAVPIEIYEYLVYYVFGLLLILLLFTHKVK